jgi:hypothetical protein
VDGLDDASGWAACFAGHGASQCGFCTPGIIVRASALTQAQRTDRAAVDRAMLAHLCRCTGWQSIVDAIAEGPSSVGGAVSGPSRRAAIEGGVAQDVGPDVVAGRGGFADDLAPPDSLVAVLGAGGEWVIGDNVADARRLSGKVQGRRSTAPIRWPLEQPHGDWARTLRTTWVEPGYLEPDAAWCEPGGEPVTPLGNGGAFGGKVASEVGQVARRLAGEHGRPVRVLYSREDVVRRGPKRPPMAIALRSDGSGVIRLGHSGNEDPDLAVAATRAGVAAAGLDVGAITVETMTVPGPPTSVALRAACWAEVMVVAASLPGTTEGAVVTPDGGRASARIDADGSVDVTVRCGEALDESVLRSYCTGAAHMALGWVRSEALAVDDHGVPVDLTIRSFGILRAVDTPTIRITVEPDDGPPVNGSDAVFTAVALAAWRVAGFPPAWPLTSR